MKLIVKNPIKTETRNGHLWVLGKRASDGVLGWNYERQTGFENVEPQQQSKAKKSSRKPHDPIEWINGIRSVESDEATARHEKTCVEQSHKVPGRQTGRFVRVGFTLREHPTIADRMIKVGGYVKDMHA